MSHLAIATDVPALANGRKVLVSAGANTLQMTFTAGGQIRIVERTNIKHIVVNDDQIGVCLHASQCIVPGTKNTVRSFKVCSTPHCRQEDWLDLVQWCTACEHALDCSADRTIALETACERTRVHVENSGNAVVLWTKNTCTVLQELKAIVLQRTTGGMSTYDAHLIPCAGTIATVDMLPHSTVSIWAETFGPDMVVNAGADPVHPRDIQQAQFVPSVQEFISGIQCMHEDEIVSSEASDWSESNNSQDDDGSSQEEDSSIACVSSSCDEYWSD